MYACLGVGKDGLVVEVLAHVVCYPGSIPPMATMRNDCVCVLTHSGFTQANRPSHTKYHIQYIKHRNSKTQEK